jgi:hypothetical protein
MFGWNGRAWVQRGDDIDGESAYGQLGKSVSIAADGQTVAVGAPYNDNSGEYLGHVRMFDWNGTAWVQRGDDIDGEAKYDEFGISVSLAADGQAVAVGAPFSDGSAFMSGHVRVFGWNGTAWVQLCDDIDGEARYDRFGSSVSLAADGQTVAVGAPNNDGNGLSSGHVRVLGWTGTAWVQRGDDIDGDAANDRFGSAVSLAADGQTVAVGAPSGNAGSGHVRMFGWNGTAWVQLGDDIDGEAAGNDLGWSVSLAAGGNIVAIGALDNGTNGPKLEQVRTYQIGCL